MQTFLPYPDFLESARVLDRQRLGKQRVEALQIMNALSNGGGWLNHPAVKMWDGHVGRLSIYAAAMCIEWMRRGYLDNVHRDILNYAMHADTESFINPRWMGDERFHSSHRAALLRKDPEWYDQFGWQEEPIVNYWWPTKEIS